MKKILAALAVTCVLTASSLAGTTVILPTSGTGFQDEGTLTADHTSLVQARDGLWAPGLPEAGSTIVHDYYANGTSTWWWDGISLSFEGIPGDADELELGFYIKYGEYGNADWHHYAVLEGAFNPIDEDAGPFAAVGPIKSFDPTVVDDNGGQWIYESIPLDWVSGGDLDVTLRLWNAPLDAVHLNVTTAPAPGAILLVGLGTGLTGWLRRRRTLYGCGGSGFDLTRVAIEIHHWQDHTGGPGIGLAGFLFGRRGRSVRAGHACAPAQTDINGQS